MVMSLLDHRSLDTVPVLTRRLEAVGVEACMELPLTAEERTRLRGRRRTACGQSVLLQLPRQGPLRPGESLAAEEGPALVRVEAALEQLLVVKAVSELALLEAAYHLGNRHVALELRTQQLRLLDDSVLADLLRMRGLLRTIGRSCYVVDDDLLIGMRYILEDIETDNEPLHAMAEAYINKSSYSPVQHDLRKPKEKMLKERVKNANAEAVIITAAKMCEPGLEEQVTYTQEFDKDNTPYFVSEFEENMSSFDHLEMQLETFVENLIFD